MLLGLLPIFLLNSVLISKSGSVHELLQLSCRVGSFRIDSGDGAEDPELEPVSFGTGGVAAGKFVALFII